jgi:hypothetical protein
MHSSITISRKQEEVAIMRTTIEIPDRYRSILHSLAVKKGLRGYSSIIEEALDAYIDGLSRKNDLRNEILQMMGSWQEEEVSEIKEKITEMRKNWNPM